MDLHPLDITVAFATRANIKYEVIIQRSRHNKHFISKRHFLFAPGFL